MARSKGLSKQENWNWQTLEAMRIRQKSLDVKPPRSNKKSGIELLDESWSDSKSEGTTNFEERGPAHLEDALLQIDQERENLTKSKFTPFTQ